MDFYQLECGTCGARVEGKGLELEKLPDLKCPKCGRSSWEEVRMTAEGKTPHTSKAGQSPLPSGLPSEDLFDENTLLPEIRNALEKRDFRVAEKSLRVLYANLADRIAAAYTENARDLLATAQENYAVLRAAVGIEPNDQPVFYLGQLNAVMELAKRLAQRTIPISAVRVVMGSEVAKQIMERLHEDGPMLVTELAEKLKKAHPYISTLLSRLEAVRVIQRRRFGHKVEVALLPIGRELALQLREDREATATAHAADQTITLKNFYETWREELDSRMKQVLVKLAPGTELETAKAGDIIDSLKQTLDDLAKAAPTLDVSKEG